MAAFQKMAQDGKENNKNLFHIPFPTMAKIVCGLPLFATFFCVTWSIFFNFKATTATHCKVGI